MMIDPSPSPKWSAWASLGGSVVSLASGRNRDGRVEVFAIGSDGALNHIWQTSLGGPWSGWAGLGGRITHLAAAMNRDRRLEVFTVGTDAGVHHIWQTSPGGSWSEWASLGGGVTSLAATSNVDGRLEVFAIGADGALNHIWQVSPGGAWSGWAGLSGRISSMAVAANADGRLEVFAIGSDGALHHISQASPGGSWNGWASLGGGITQLAAAENLDGRIEVFAIGTDAAVHHIWQVTANGGWSGWDSLGGGVTRLTTARHGDGRLGILAIGTDGALNHIWQTNAGWSSWTGLGGKISALTAAVNLDGLLEVFAIGSDNGLHHLRQIPSEQASTYALHLTAEPAEGGRVTGDGVYVPGTQLSARAYPSTGWAFRRWTENGAEVSRDSAAFLVTMDRPHTYVATFERTDAPGNSTRATALTITEGYSGEFNTANAPVEDGDPPIPNCGGHGDPHLGKTIWFRFTPAQTASYGVICETQTLDVVFAVYAGTDILGCGWSAYQGVEGEPSTGAGGWFDLQAGTTYHIRVGGSWGSSGIVKVILRHAMIGLVAVLQPGPPPLRVRFDAVRKGYPILPVPVVLVQFRAAASAVVVVRIDGTPVTMAASAEEQLALARRGEAHYTVTTTLVEGGLRWELRVVRARIEGWNAPWIPYTVSISDGPDIIQLPIVARVRPSEVFFEGRTFEERCRLNSKTPLSIIAREVVMQGWLLESAGGPSDQRQIEDWHWNLIPDPAFIAAAYHGLGRPPGNLGAAFLPGNPQHNDREPPDPAKRIPFVDYAPDGTSRGITLNSFILPRNIGMREGNVPFHTYPVIHMELNGWFAGGPRGAAPAGWIPNTALVRQSDTVDDGTYWAYNPANPDGTGDLQAGDYVRVYGTLWQDSSHDGGCWDEGAIPADEHWPNPRWIATHGGWIEIHPPDWIVRLPPPVRETTVAGLELCGNGTQRKTLHISPDFTPDTGLPLRVRSVTALVDGRFTDERTVVEHRVDQAEDHVDVTVTVKQIPTVFPVYRPGRFKAVYLVTWEPDTYALHLMAEPAEGGSVTGEGVYVRGTQLSARAYPSTGWAFRRWTENGAEVSRDPAAFLVTMDRPHTYVAAFERTATPGNSTRATALTITAGYSGEFNTANAPVEDGDAPIRDCGGHGDPRLGKAIWFRFTPSQTGSYGVICETQTFDVVFAVYSGTDILGCGWSAYQGVEGEVSTGAGGWFDLQAGTTYHIRVGGAWGGSGIVKVSLRR